MFDIGSSLRDARTRQNLDFPELEERTKIRPKYLRALEDERFDILPAPTYVRGFLRSYAEALGLDGQPFVDEYNSRFATGEDDVVVVRARRVPPPRRDRRDRESHIALLALVAIAVVTALVIAAWNYGGGGTAETRIPNLAPATRPHVQSSQAVFVVRAVDGSSLLETRKGGATGKVVFQGTLEKGEKQRFVAKELWLNVGSPENLVVTLGGRPATLGNGCPQVVTVTRRQVTSKSSCG